MPLLQRLWRFHRDALLREAKKKGEDKGPYVGETFVFIATSRCNFSCKHCLRSLEQPTDLPLDVALRTLEEGRKFNFRTVAITGGEPLLYPHLEAVTERAAALDYKIGLVTNGFDLPRHTAYLRRYKKSFGYIAFSLESADPRKHDALRRSGSFARLMDDFDLCRREEIPFRAQATIGRHNIEEVLDIALLAKKKRIPHLSFTTILPCPRSQDNDLVLSAPERQELFWDLLALQRTLHLSVRVAADIRAYANTRLCHPMNLREVAIDAAGHVVQCCEVADFDHPVIRNFTRIADLKTESLPEALKKLSAYFHRFTCARIDDMARTPAQDADADFNSCFYCLRKIPALSGAPADTP
ncbi:MAG: radical SAM protein [Deltaproteobacteria bacterium]